MQQKTSKLRWILAFLGLVASFAEIPPSEVLSRHSTKVSQSVHGSVATVADSSGDSVEEDGDSSQEPSSQEPLDVEALVDVSETLLPSQASVIVIGVLTSVKLMHDNIQAAFKTMPGNSCIFLISFLGMFCWTVLGTMWKLDMDAVTHLGTCTTLSSYIATANLMLTPIILLIPDQEKTKRCCRRRVSSEAQEAVEKVYKDNKRKLAVLYLLVMFFQVASAPAVFRITKVKEAAMKDAFQQTQDHPLASTLGLEVDNGEKISGPVMATVLYLILSWSSLCVLYERMFPGRSFAADFPAQVMENAFGCQREFLDIKVRIEEAKSVMREARTQAAIARVAMQDRLDQAGVPLPPEADAVQEQVKAATDNVANVSAAVTSLLDGFTQEAEGITARIEEFIQAVDSHYCFFYLHYILYVAYGACTMVGVGWLGMRIAKIIISSQHGHSGVQLNVIVFCIALCIYLCFFCALLIFASFGTMGMNSSPPIMAGSKMAMMPSPEVMSSSIEMSRGEVPLPPPVPAQQESAHRVERIDSIEDQIRRIELNCDEIECIEIALERGFEKVEAFCKLEAIERQLQPWRDGFSIDDEASPSDSASRPLLSSDEDITRRIRSAVRRVESVRRRLSTL